MGIIDTGRKRAVSLRALKRLKGCLPGVNPADTLSIGPAALRSAVLTCSSKPQLAKSLSRITHLKKILNSERSLPHTYGDNAWDGKPVAIMGALIGMLGSARAQYHLRQCCVYLNMYPVNQPEVIINFAAERFDVGGNLLDDKTKELIARLLKNLVSWTRLLKEQTRGPI